MRGRIRAHLEGVLAAVECWQRWASERAAWAEVAEACEAGLRAAAELHRTQLERDHQLVWLRSTRGLPAAAALAHDRLGDPRKAVSTLDSGRALLLADALERDRADLRALAERAPTLGARYTAAAAALDDALRAVARRDDARR